MNLKRLLKEIKHLVPFYGRDYFINVVKEAWEKAETSEVYCTICEKKWEILYPLDDMHEQLYCGHVYNWKTGECMDITEFQKKVKYVD